MFDSTDNEKTVYFRADMNSQIASGHVMRCLSIADALKKKGIKSIFIAADDIPAQLITSRGYEIRVLETDWQDMESETEELFSCTGSEPKTDGKGKPVMFVDSYQATPDYFRRICKRFYTVYTDDFLDTAYPVDMLLCYPVYADLCRLEDVYGKSEIKLPKLLLGMEYAPMREMFSCCKKHYIKECIENVFIMTGGTDKYNMLDALLENIGMVKRHINFIAVCGLLYPERDELIQKYEKEENIRIIAPVNNIIDYYEWADVVVTAGGTSLYELCAAGTPAITFSFADNQFLNVRTFDKKDVMKYAGDARTDNVPENVMRLLDIYGDKNIRYGMSEKEQKLVDGKGADRITRELTDVL